MISLFQSAAMTTRVFYILLLSAFVTASNLREPRQAEISNRFPVEYRDIRDIYSFMARIVMDSRRCGGAVIAPR